MSQSTGTHLDSARARLRDLVNLVQAQIDHVDSADPALAASFKALVTEMALGPATEVTPCPHCGQLGMKGATRCIQCWSKLTPS